MVDQLLHGSHLAPVERGSLLLDKVKEARLFYKRYLNGLGNAASPISIRKSGQKVKVIKDGKGWRKGTDKVFLPECIDAVFNADSGIVLCKHSSRNPDQPYAPVRCRSRVANHIDKCAAAYRHHKGVS